jgi:hypothetical protein
LLVDALLRKSMSELALARPKKVLNNRVFKMIRSEVIFAIAFDSNHISHNGKGRGKKYTVGLLVKIRKLVTPIE